MRNWNFGGDRQEGVHQSRGAACGQCATCVDYVTPAVVL